jgi:hypothetical protein
VFRELRVQFAPVPELITAEGTVVEGQSKKAKQTPQRVRTHAVDFIRPAQDPELTIVTQRALTTAFEDGEERPINVEPGAAVSAAKRGAGEDPEYQAPAAARKVLSTSVTTHW